MKHSLQLSVKCIFLIGMLFLFAGNVHSYTPPTALRILWMEQGGLDQTATCHDYGDYITNVTFAGINNTSAGSGPKAWHTDYGRTTPQVVIGEVTIGQAYTISITLASSDYSYDYAAVYVDWNQDGENGDKTTLILDNNENPLVWNGLTGSGTKTLTGTITVPTGILTGQIYMRVMIDCDSNNPASGNFTCGVGIGEFQDYVLNVSASSIAPTVTTQAVTAISTTTATGNGNVTSLGAPNPTAHGVCWNTTGSPTVSDSKVDNGAKSSTGAFTASMTSLSTNTTYYVRAYATNTAGTSYGTQVSFTTLTNGTFTAATNNDWATATNWAGGVVPSSSTDVSIPTGKTAIINSNTSADCNNLSVSGNLSIQSSVSGTGSLKINGTSTGNVTCQRYMTTGKWHLVSPIAIGGSISDFIQVPENAIALSGSNYGMMDYIENSNTWNSYFTASISSNFATGKGYAIRRSTDGVVSFTGTLSSGTNTVSITKTGAEGWNLIGNPYCTSINMNNAANGTYNFLKTNAIDASKLDASYACIYLWDATSSTYKILGNTSYSGRDLDINVFAPGQAFFVKAASSGTVEFNKNMQVQQTNSTYKTPNVNVSWPGMTLAITNASTNASTIITFNENMTKGLDPTYDAGLFRGTNGLSLYSRLVEDNGVDFAVQCLPVSYKNLIIPIGLDNKDGGEITFSAETVNLPVECSVILEDKTNKTFTSLSGGATYKAIVPAGATSIGRFYIHTDSNEPTGIPKNQTEISELKAYIINGELIIKGEVSKKTQVSLYNSYGQKVLSGELLNGWYNKLTCTELMNGVYLLTINQNGEILTVKLIK